MQKIVKQFFRVFALIFHLFQAVISITAGAYISAVIGAILFGIYIYDFETIKRLFHVPPLVVSILGTVLWLIIAVIEFTPMK